MNLEVIKTKLDQSGYYSYYAGNDLIVGKKVGVFPELNGINVKAFCMIRLEGTNFVIESGEANIVKEDRFSSNSKVVHFIQTTFPL